MRVNREIRAPKVRVIGPNGEQIGILPIEQARKEAFNAGLDLVEVAPTAAPPVCRIIDYGKFRYDQTKKEKESKKAQHQIKVKEVKLKPNIAEHDFETKLRHAKDFILEGNKVKVTCTFRGREMAHPEIGERIVQRMIDSMEEIAQPESIPKRMGRTLSLVLAPAKKKPKSKEI